MAHDLNDTIKQDRPNGLILLSNNYQNTVVTSEEVLDELAKTQRKIYS